MKRPVIGLNMDFTEKWDGKTRMAVRAEYVDAVVTAGGWPLPVPCLREERLLAGYVDRVDGFLFIGGEDYSPALYREPPHEKTRIMHERRMAADLPLAGLVLDRDLPVLGVCGGAQLICIRRGGRLIQHLPTASAHVEDQYHEADISGGKILSGLLGPGRIRVNSAHHQAVDPGRPGDGIEIVARSTDGVVEAIESTRHRFVLGVQWHPERMDDDAHRRKIFSALIAAAGKAR